MPAEAKAWDDIERVPSLNVPTAPALSRNAGIFSPPDSLTNRGKKDMKQAQAQRKRLQYIRLRAMIVTQLAYYGA